MFRKSTTSLTLALFLFTPMLLSVACGGGDSGTRARMIEWAQALQLHITTSSESNYTFPKTLDGIEPDLQQGLNKIDSWGNALQYRRWRDDRYDLVSAGPDGQFGNGDDIVSVNGKFTKPDVVYAERPFRQ